jgi:hypothetical protein
MSPPKDPWHNVLDLVHVRPIQPKVSYSIRADSAKEVILGDKENFAMQLWEYAVMFVLVHAADVDACVIE